MRIKLATQFFAILLAASSFSCSNKEEAAEPLSTIVGRWDYKKLQITEYDADGEITSDHTSLLPVGYGYELFKADKTCSGKHYNQLLYTGQYTCTKTLLTITSDFATRATPLITFTSTELVYVTDGRHGKAGAVRTHYFVKH